MKNLHKYRVETNISVIFTDMALVLFVQNVTDSSMRHKVRPILCKIKFDSFAPKQNIENGSQGKNMAKVGKSGQKLEKTAKVAKSCKKIPQIGKNIKNSQ